MSDSAHPDEYPPEVPDPSPADDASDPAVDEDIEPVVRLHSWLEQLESCRGDAPEPVVRRVREDYLARLETVRERLAPRLGELRERADRLRAELAAVTEPLDAANDELQALRLRHRVGELNAAELAEAAAPLERVVAENERIRQRIRPVLDRLSIVLAEPPEAVEAPRDETFTPTAPAAARQKDAPLPWLETLHEPAVGAGPSAPAANVPSWLADDDAATPPPAPRGRHGEAVVPDDELAFLDELDRAIEAGASRPVHGASEPVGGLTCRKCGAAGEVQAWFCDRCGAELS